jgi:hypothetical protein
VRAGNLTWRSLLGRNPRWLRWKEELLIGAHERPRLQFQGFIAVQYLLDQRRRCWGDSDKTRGFVGTSSELVEHAETVGDVLESCWHVSPLGFKADK